MKKLAICGVLLLILTLYLPAVQNNLGARGIFTISYPFTLAKGLASFRLGDDNIDLETGNIDVNAFFLGASYTVIDNLELNVNLTYNRVHRRDFTGINSEYPFASGWQENLGFARLGFKYNFLKNPDTGLGIAGFYALPLSDEDAAVTTGKSVFGADLLFAHTFASRVILSANAGYHMYQDPDDMDIADIFRYAAGVEIMATEGFGLIGQISGKAYGDSGLPNEQEAPLDGILGVKFENDRFGMSFGYKKNLAFSGENLGDTHGGIGSIWIKTTPPPPPPPECIAVEGVSIQGPSSATSEGTYSYQASITPTDATAPVSYTWSSSDNGSILSGQNSPTVSVKWTREGETSWVQVNAKNECSEESGRMAVSVARRIPVPSKEYYFAFDSAELTDCLTEELDRAVDYFTHHPDKSILLLGFTCSIATEEYNLALGEHRANAVKEYLMDHGISPNRIKTVSYGEALKINIEEYGVIAAYDNSMEKTRKKNRRVYIPFAEK